MTLTKNTTTTYAKVVPDCPECGLKMVLEHVKEDYTVHCGNPACSFYLKSFLQPLVKVEMISFDR